MEFISPYANDEPAPDEIIVTNFIRILSDSEYQAGALERYGRDETLEPYVLISEDAVWREGQETPALFIKDVSAFDLEDTGQGLKGTIRFTCYHLLAERDGEQATAILMRQAYRRNRAVEMMCRFAPRDEVFKDLNVGGRGKVLVTRREPSDTMPGKASYYRLPSVTVEVRLMGGA